MSNKIITIEPTNNQVENNQINILDDIKSLSFATINPVPGIVDALKAIWGPEGRKDIWIKNKLNSNIQIQFIDGKTVNETIHSESEVVFNKNPRDGILGTKKYECRVTSESKRAKFFCYGYRAPRKDNRFEVREDGIYLIDEAGEHRICEWETDQVDHPGHQTNLNSGKLNFLIF